MLIRELIAAYKAHQHSGYRTMRHKARRGVDRLLARVAHKHSTRTIASYKAETLIERYAEWSADGRKPSMGHSLIGVLRRLFRFGFLFLEDADCERMMKIAGEMRFKNGKRREQFVTPAQAVAICAEAHRVGRASVALAQAAMTDFGWRQKDAIGEYVPRDEPGESEVQPIRYGKWLYGMRWEEIGSNMVVQHTTSKRGKLSCPPLIYAPMFLRELGMRYPGFIVVDAATGAMTLNRAVLPAKGPVVVNEKTGWPYTDGQFREAWRAIATGVGIPKEVQNRDTRAGKATDALKKGVPIDRVQQLLGHSSIKTTMNIYARDSAGAAAAAMKQIAEAS